MKFTILGSTGFIGSSLTNYLKSQAIQCDTLDLRTDKINEKSLGHVLYAIGVGDFIKRPFDAVTAHVCELQKILTKCKFDSFLYFSATRMYYKSNTTKETDPIITNPLDTNDLYAISKVMAVAIEYLKKQNQMQSLIGLVIIKVIGGSVYLIISSQSYLIKNINIIH